MKEFFPNVQDRLKMKINITTNFVTMVAGHSKTRDYFHHFKIMKQATYPCNNTDQTIDHLLCPCTLLHSQIGLLRNKVLKIVNWPASKQELTK